MSGRGGGGSEPPRAKAVYEPVAKLEAFYTGGCVRVTRDNRHLACACGDEVKVLDVASGGVAATLPGDSEPITSLALSPDCRTLVAASRSLSVRLWDWGARECKRTWKPHRAPVADLAIDASGGYVASGSADRSIKVTDLAGGFTTHHFTGHAGIVLRVLFHPKQLLLLSSDDQGEVRVWDLVTKACAFNLSQGHMSAVPALALSPDGWLLLSGGRDKVVCVWDIRHGTRLATLPVYEALEGLAVLPLGSAFPGVQPAATAAGQGSGVAGPAGKTLFFATAGERGVLRIWRSDSGAAVYTYHGSSSSLLQQGPGGKAGKAGKSGKAKKAHKAAASGAGDAAVAGSEFMELLLLPGGKGLLAATGDARLLFYAPAASPDGEPELALTRQLVGNHDEITDLTFLHSGSSSSSSSSNGSGSDEALVAQPDAAGASAGGLALQPGEPRRLAVATNSHDVRLFELTDASCVGACVGHRDIVLCLDTVRPAPGVELLASGAKDCEARVWDAASCRCLGVAAGHVAAVTAVAWSKSKAKAGRYLATGGADKLLKLWDTSKLLATATAAAADGSVPPAHVALSTLAAVAGHDKDVNALAFSPNDALLASGSQDKTIKLWRLPSLVLAATLRGHKRGVWDLAFSPSEQVLLSCSGDRLVKLWSVSEGTCLRTFEGHTAGVLRCRFLTAGTQVLSAGADGLLKLWDTRSGTNQGTFEAHEDRLWGLTASDGPAESLLASGGGDARVVVWRDVTAARAAAAEAAEEGLALRQQELSNALADGDYATAARLAFQLRHPGRLLEVLRRQPGGPAAALEALQALVGRLDPADLATALSYCREWNSNTRNAHLAQVLLRAVLSSHTPQQILQVPGARELVAGLLAYSERHATRLERLMRATFLLDYTLAASQVLLPADAHDAADAEAEAEAAAAAAAPAAAAAAGAGAAARRGGGVLAMNGHAGGGSSDSDSDSGDGQPQALAEASGSLESSEGDEDVPSSMEEAADEEDEAEQEAESSDEEPEEQEEDEAPAAVGSKRRRPREQAQRAGRGAGADSDSDAQPLPGWGGGDSDDDWGGSDDGGDDVALQADDLLLQVGGGSGSGSGSGTGSEGDSGSEGEGGSGSGSGSEEGDDEERPPPKAAQPRGRGKRAQLPQAAQPRQSPRQRPQLRPAGGKWQAPAAAGVHSPRTAAVAGKAKRARRPRQA